MRLRYKLRHIVYVTIWILNTKKRDIARARWGKKEKRKIMIIIRKIIWWQNQKERDNSRCFCYDYVGSIFVLITHGCGKRTPTSVRRRYYRVDFRLRNPSSSDVVFVMKAQFSILDPQNRVETNTCFVFAHDFVLAVRYLLFFHFEVFNVHTWWRRQRNFSFVMITWDQYLFWSLTVAERALRHPSEGGILG